MQTKRKYHRILSICCLLLTSQVIYSCIHIPDLNLSECILACKDENQSCVADSDQCFLDLKTCFDKIDGCSTDCGKIAHECLDQLTECSHQKEACFGPFVDCVAVCIQDVETKLNDI